MIDTTLTSDDDIYDRARRWAALDKDKKTKAAMEQLIAAGDADGLRLRLDSRIAFGTAGLRAEMDCGPGRMNCMTVSQTSAGLADYLAATVPDAKERGIVLGRDGRHNSGRFAMMAAMAFVSRGFQVWWFDRLVHTPLIPFAVREKGAAGGVMITASHNPKTDNGYKVYGQTGCQIVSPADAQISACIDAIIEDEIAWPGRLPVNEQEVGLLAAINLVEECDGYFDSYIGRVKSLLTTTTNDASHAPDFVYTPLHGTGLRPMKALMTAIGRETTMSVVAEQADPDGDFPTVVFPNPEEAGALDVATATADRLGLGLVLASDPDADRFAAAERQPDGNWHRFSGNEIGALLAAHLIETTDQPSRNLAMIASAVSGRMVSNMAAAAGVPYADTLTGFKWIGSKALSLQVERASEAGTTDDLVVFGYEEALGYMFASLVPDKDSIAAATVFLTAIGRWRRLAETSTNADGSFAVGAKTVMGKLEQLRLQHGFSGDANCYVRSPSPAATRAVFAAIRSGGGAEQLVSAARGIVYPAQLGRFQMRRWIDLTLGFDSAGSAPEFKPELPVSADAEMISCQLSSPAALPNHPDIYFTIRASGTEPKIKLYIEAESGESMAAAAALAAEFRQVVMSSWLGSIPK